VFAEGFNEQGFYSSFMKASVCIEVLLLPAITLCSTEIQNFLLAAAASYSITKEVSKMVVDSLLPGERTSGVSME
jgi:hypothetical protein